VPVEYVLFAESRPLGGLVRRWVRAFDPDGSGGLGTIVLTADLDTAIRFANLESAVTFWQQQSTLQPLRDDGKPNRPLTAFTVVVQTLKAAQQMAREVAHAHVHG
jgi:hypothetical protein